MASWVSALPTSEISEGERKSLEVDDTLVLLFQIGDQYFAIEDICTHDGQPLTDGPLEGQAITCPRHGAQFDLNTGKPLCMPATQPARVFETKSENGTIFINEDS